MSHADRLIKEIKTVSSHVDQLRAQMFGFTPVSSGLDLDERFKAMSLQQLSRHVLNARLQYEALLELKLTRQRVEQDALFASQELSLRSVP